MSGTISTLRTVNDEDPRVLFGLLGNVQTAAHRRELGSFAVAPTEIGIPRPAAEPLTAILGRWSETYDAPGLFA